MFYLIITSFIWAFSYSLIKVNLGNLDPNFVSFSRLCFALLVFVPLLRPAKIATKEIVNLMFIGAIQYGFMYLCFARSFKYLDAHQVALFTTFTPLYVILVNDLFNKKFNPVYLLIASIAMLGGAFIYYSNFDLNQIFKGFILVQFADLCFAFGQVAYKRFRAVRIDIKDQQIYAFLFLGAMLTTAAATTIYSGWDSLTIVSNKQILLLIYLGFLASGLCFFLWNKGATLTNTTTLAVFNNLKSPLAVAVSIIFFHESADIFRLTVGLAIICGALLLSEFYNRKINYA